MKPLRSVAIFLAVVFLGGAMVAPWLYWLAQACAPAHPWFQKLADRPFHQFVSRACQVLAVVGLWPFLRSLEIRTWSGVGLVAPRGQWNKLFTGLALGFVSLAAAAAVPVIAGIRTVSLEHSTDNVLRHLVNAGLAAIIVGVLEEVIFRGALFGALRKAHHWIAALLISSAVYSLVHFFKKPPPPESISWVTGLMTLGRMLGGFVEVAQLIPGFLNLLLAGSLLALAYQRTGNLYFSIGLHAGWIFWLKSFDFLTKTATTTNSWFWGPGRLRDGWATFLLLILTLVVFTRLPVARRQESRA